VDRSAKRALEESNREGAKGTSARPRKLQRENSSGRTLPAAKARTMFIQHRRYGARRKVKSKKKFSFFPRLLNATLKIAKERNDAFANY